MLKKIFQKLYNENKAIALLVLAVLLVGGCMETITPTDKETSKLTVRVVLIANQDTTRQIPLIGKDVKIFDVNDRKTVLQQGLTDDLGNVVFELSVPKVGQNLYVETIHNGLTLSQTGVLVCTDASVTFMFFDSTGCKASCPFLQKEFNTPVEFGAPLKGDTVSNRGDNKMLVSATTTLRNTWSYKYTISNPDSACAAVVVNIAVDTTGVNDKQHKNASAYNNFKVSPASLSLNPGESGVVEVVFSAPTKNELDLMVSNNKQNNKTDSILSVRLKFTVAGRTCFQDVDLSASLVVIPDLSPIINLRPFRQITKQVPVPDNEVYYFGNLDKNIVRHTDKSPIFDTDPMLGDIFLDVPNNDSTANPPQAPILKLVTTSSAKGMKVWKTGYSQYPFVTVIPVNNEFSADANRANGYSTNPISPLSPGDVIAIQYSNSTYALLYVRAVDDGSKNSSLQSAIEFRALYPVIAP